MDEWRLWWLWFDGLREKKGVSEDGRTGRHGMYIGGGKTMICRSDGSQGP